MNGLVVTLKKELLSYACSPISYVIAVLFYLWRGFEVCDVLTSFSAYQADTDLLPTACYSLQSTFLMVLLVPAILTMRCFAEERKTGSIETLMTAPVRDFEVAVGKWLAALVFYSLLWLPTVLLLWALTLPPFLDTPIAFGPVFSAYLGMFLLSSMLLAFGCFASSLTDNLMLAVIVAVLFDIGVLSLPMMLRSNLGKLAENFYVAQLLEKIDFPTNFGQWFARGLIDTSQVWFYLGGTLFFLFCTVLSLAARRVA